MTHWYFFDYAFTSIKSRCKWIFFFDIDEFLEFTDKSMTLKNYLEMPTFNKCDVIRIHWMMYDDNNLTYYDNRTVKERFTHGLPYDRLNIYHKSIVRGKDYGPNIFIKGNSNHQPSEENTTQCDALGNIERLPRGILGRPKFKYCYIRHHKYKTAEEFAIKLLRGRHQSTKFDYETYINEFAKSNKLTEEKLKIFEHILNKTFPKFHKNIPNNN